MSSPEELLGQCCELDFSMSLWWSQSKLDFARNYLLDVCNNTGKWKAVTPGGWSTAKRKEVETFLTMARQWYGNLDLLESIEQV